ncbi:AAA family ATPase, partial [Enterococcus faecalis]|nr:AAA family ATPase [Enterococcus faecalis]
DKIIPIRNKIMHTRPIEFSDRGILEEALYKIDEEIPFIDWNELSRTREKVKNNPQKLIVETTFNPEPDNTTNIYHNLPVPEFDDTGYIGRKKEIKELHNLINSDKNQIITVVGNGGIGKTAIVVKSLYELLDGPNPYKFEAIIWISLKTKTLSNGEFININDSINELGKMYSELHKNTVDDTEDSKKDILNFMNEFKTLLVIDNLETIPTEEIIDFLKDIPSKSKVLLTSRSGLGELENRYSLQEMSKEDARQYFISLSNYYQLELHKQDHDKLDNLIKNHLYSSPLSIKWYITSVFYGADPISVLNDKNDLVEFAMSNIVDHLTRMEIEILWLLLIEGKSLSYGEIDYYLEPKDVQTLITSINKLSSTSMLRSHYSGSYEINGMAKDYLKTYKAPNGEFIKNISKKRTFLNSMMQEIKTKNEAEPFNPKSLFSNMKNENTKIASYYLIKALEYSGRRDWENAELMIKKAENVAPNYFEVYKIKAFISAENNNLLDAITSYRIAIENTQTELELASVYYLFSVFYTIKLTDYILAKEFIEKADELSKNQPIITLEKGRVYMYLGEYENAREVFEGINKSDLKTDKILNQYASRLSDLYRRMAGNYNNRDKEKKHFYLKKAIDVINELTNVDPKTGVTLIRTLTDLTYNLSYEPSLDLFNSTFNRYIGIIQNNKSNYIKNLRKQVIYNNTLLPKLVVEKASNLGVSFSRKANEITENNKGIIIKLTETFGFIKNAHQNFYFKVYDIKYSDPNLGDKVSFEIRENERGDEATHIEKCID